MAENKMVVFSGNSNPLLSNAIIERLGIPLGNAIVKTFSDGEIMVEILESVRGDDVYIIQSTCAPTNDNLMELLVMVDAIRSSSARRITAIIPYFGYARQDRRPRSARVPITSKVVTNMICNAGVDRVLTVDLHADQIQGFFSVPVDNVYSSPILLGDIWHQNYSNPIVVSPDVGGVVRARAFAKHLEFELSIIDKRRQEANESEVMHIIGKVQDRTCIIVDDMVDTAGTLCKAALRLKENGAIKVVAYVTHPVLSGRAIKTIENSVLDELVVTDTIPLNKEAENCQRIRVLSNADMLAEIIRRLHKEESISDIFMD